MKAPLIAALILAFTGGAVAEQSEPLRESEEGSYRALATRPRPQHLHLVFIPSLAAVLLSEERKKGEPLSRTEVESIRDNATVIVGTIEVVESLEQAREY